MKRNKAGVWLLPDMPGRHGQTNYVQWMRSHGLTVEALASGAEIPDDVAHYAALLLPGGGDVEPALYGAKEIHPRTRGIHTTRDAREIELIRRFLEASRPVFGICRGLQIINVAFGGELYQHVPDVVPERIERHRKRPTTDASHGVQWDLQTRMGWCLQNIAQVNSAHHQAIDPKCVGRGLQITARSSAGVIEAVECLTREAPVAAVQWHPERMPDGSPGSEAVMEYFMTLADE